MTRELQPDPSFASRMVNDKNRTNEAKDPECRIKTNTPRASELLFMIQKDCKMRVELYSQELRFDRYEFHLLAIIVAW